jgi:predicted secreted protein
MTNPIAGFSTTIKYAAGTLIGKLTSIGGIKLKAETIDITNHDSPDGYKEFIAGLKDGGEFPMEGNFIQSDAGQLAIMASFGTGAVESFIVTFPDTSTWTFSAIVTGVEVGKADLKDQLTFSATLKISGKPVFAGVTSVSTVTFTVTAAAGGAAVSGAVIVFNGETKTTGTSGIVSFSNVLYGDLTYGITKTSMVGQAKVITVNGATEAEAVALVAA